MKSKNKGNLLVTFILLIGLCAVVLSLAAFISIRLQETGFRVNDRTAFYYADAGLNKAIWYLSAPTSVGGKGMTWRISGSKEAYGRGDYVYSIVNTAVSSEVRIISTGEVGVNKSTITQVMSLTGYPTAFNYALYTGTDALLNSNVTIYGDMYINGDTTINSNASVNNGYVYHPTGTTISGAGTWTDGGAKTPAPSNPTIDTTYYDNLINTAKTKAAGGLDYSGGTVNLNGQTLYVNGYVHVNSATTFVGPGRIVSSADITFNGDATATGAVEFIANTSFTMDGNTSASSATMYSAGTFTNNGNTRVDVGAMIAKSDITISGTITMSGLVFTLGNVLLQGSPQITGVVCSAALSGTDTMNGPCRITYDQTKLPSTLPAGFTATSLSRKQGTWKEY